MTPAELRICRLLAPFDGPAPATVREWAAARPNVKTDADVQRYVDRHAQVASFLEEERRLEAAARARLVAVDELPIVWSQTMTLDREPRPWQRAVPHTLVLKPGPKPRGPRVGCPLCHGKVELMMTKHTDADMLADQDAIARLAHKYRPRNPHAGPVTLNVEACFAPPASWPEWEKEAALAGAIRPTSHQNGDYDNLAKNVADALTRAGTWWTDDSLVVEGLCAKRYAARAGWYVEVFFLKEPKGRDEWIARRGGAQLNLFTTALDAALSRPGYAGAS